MSVFRTYFSKNNTLIDNNLTNNSQNPVTEISYGTVNKQVSRLIFDLNLEPLISRIDDGHINPNRIVKHVLHMTNTIQHADQYLGKKSYSLEIERASSFSLDIFNISEDWDEGSGYDFVYNTSVYPRPQESASNWTNKKTNIPWISGGSYQSGVTTIFGTQSFEKGNEDVEIDVTDYVNGKLGVSGFTGTTYGLGLKFSDSLEDLETTFRQATAFHIKDTHTFYEPYIETIVDDGIVDDRNYFYLDKDNNLFLYSNQDLVVNSVNIFDNENNVVSTITGSSISTVGKGVYSIPLNLDSDVYTDSVLFNDVWNFTINGKTREVDNQFYLISADSYLDFDMSNQIEFDNYSFYFWGINQLEKIIAGDIRKVKLTIKELYANQDNFVPLDVEYRLFISMGGKHELDVIPFTPVNRTSKGYEFNLDTSWLLPQDYLLQLRLKNGNYYENKEYVKFTVVSNELKKH